MTTATQHFVAQHFAFCSGGCSGNGRCSTGGTCECDLHWSGRDCSFFLPESAQEVPDHNWFLASESSCGVAGCSGSNGQCMAGTCICRAGFFGPTCADSLCSNDCFGHGECDNGACLCASGWTGPQCQLSGQHMHHVGGAAFGIGADGQVHVDDEHSQPETRHPHASLLETSAFEKVKQAAHSASAAAEELYARVARENEKDAERRIKRAIERAHGNKMALPGHEFSGSSQEAALLEKVAESQPQGIIPEGMPMLMGCGNSCSGHGVCNATSASCDCQPGWAGAFCDMQPCPDDCNHHGMCIGGTCVCEQDRFGDRCQHIRCEDDCSGHGYCFAGRCQCTGDYGGATCYELIHTGTVIDFILPERRPVLKGIATASDSTVRASPLPGCPTGCSGHGTCLQEGLGGCECDAGYTGTTCSDFCPTAEEGFDCSGHGDCIHGSCLCLAGWVGARCDRHGCCSGHGTCNTDDASCWCDHGWTGAECSIELMCPDQTCSGHGVCSHGSCMCGPGYSGVSCEDPVRSCLELCGDHGTCDVNTHQCVCGDGWTGPLCTVAPRNCPNECSGNGHCFVGVCSCFAEFRGNDCSELALARTNSLSDGTVQKVAHPTLLDNVAAESPCVPGLEFVDAVNGTRIYCNGDPNRHNGTGMLQLAIAPQHKDDSAPITAPWIPMATPRRQTSAAASQVEQEATEAMATATLEAMPEARSEPQQAVHESLQLESTDPAPQLARPVPLTRSQLVKRGVVPSKSALAPWVIGSPDHRAARQDHRVSVLSKPSGVVEDDEGLRRLEVGLPAVISTAL